MIREKEVDYRVKSARANLALLKMKVSLLRSYLQQKEFDPNQPRHPAGQSDGGRWSGRDPGYIDGFQRKPIPNSQFSSLAKNSQEYCDDQYKRDVFQCKMVGLRSCYAQAMVRLVACERGHPIPPLNY